MDSADRYKKRGVSSAKEEVHRATESLDKGIFPGAFCKIIEDHLGGDPKACLAMHADTAGTKTALAYLAYRETGDAGVFKGIAQDALVMNLDDLLCIGATTNILYSSTIGRNAHLIDEKALAALIEGHQEFEERMRSLGIELIHTGGETADVGDVVRLLDVGVTTICRLPRNQVISFDKAAPGNLIVGLASDGQATYEDAYNSGIGSNGLTSARHDLLHNEYSTNYPETCSPQTPPDLVYSGPYTMNDKHPELPVTIGNALLSPTRTYAPIIKEILEHHREKVTGMIHCTGGGQTKCLKFGSSLHYIKDNPFEPPPIFKLIQEASGTTWEQMYRTFNMGHRFELLVNNRDSAEAIKDIASKHQVQATTVGYIGASKDGKNHLTLALPNERLEI
jgi:phosphoribosylformylglycinamidine cyclo-ligase